MKMNQEIIQLFDEYTHKPLSREVFLNRLTKLVGGVAALNTILPALEGTYSASAIVAEELLNLIAPHQPQEMVFWYMSTMQN